MALDYIYGRHPVLEALHAGARVQQLLVAEGQKESGTLAEILAAAAQRGAAVERVSKGKLTQLVGRDANHQGVVAALPPFRYSSVETILARAEGEVGLRAFFDRFPQAQPAGTGQRRDTRVLRGWSSLPVRLGPEVSAARPV